MQVIERVEAHYEVQEIAYGTVYRWCPGCLLLECDCGESLECKSPTDHCRCGAGCAAAFEGLDQELWESQKAPWRREQYRSPAEGAGDRERDYRSELRALE